MRFGSRRSPAGGPGALGALRKACYSPGGTQGSSAGRRHEEIALFARTRWKKKKRDRREERTHTATWIVLRARRARCVRVNELRGKYRTGCPEGGVAFPSYVLHLGTCSSPTSSGMYNESEGSRHWWKNRGLTGDDYDGDNSLRLARAALTRREIQPGQAAPSPPARGNMCVSHGTDTTQARPGSRVAVDHAAIMPWRKSRSDCDFQRKGRTYGTCRPRLPSKTYRRLLEASLALPSRPI